MARFLAILCGVLWIGTALGADRPAVLLAAKDEYLKQSEAARDVYLQAIDAQVKALAGDPDAALRLRTHRGAWLLGDISAAEFRAFESSGSTPEHLAAVDACINAEAECRKTLAAAYQQIIDEAKFIKKDEEAAGYQQELESFNEGRYVPTSFEVRKPKPYDVRRVALEPELILSATATKIPDELFVEFRDPPFIISGTKRSDSANVDGKTSRDVGKAVVINLAKDGPKLYRGYFMIGTMEPGTDYSIITVTKTKLAQAVPLNDLELDTVYEWTVEIIRDAFRIEVRHNGASIASERVAAPAGSLFGFSATARREGSEARIVVAVE